MHYLKSYKKVKTKGVFTSIKYYKKKEIRPYYFCAFESGQMQYCRVIM